MEPGDLVQVTWKDGIAYKARVMRLNKDGVTAKLKWLDDEENETNQVSIAISLERITPVNEGNDA